MTESLLFKTIKNCKKCPRLRSHCLKIAQTKKVAYKNETYFGLPISGFGDIKGELFIVGLAPGAHGANRTGRVFTGDQSGLWLYRALYKAGFSNQSESKHSSDNLKLLNTYISCIVKCAPPQNKPTTVETETCISYFKNEIQLANQARVFLILGQFALKWFWKATEQPTVTPKFKHGNEIELHTGQKIILSYHPSQQNTFTKKLTEPMFDDVFKKIKKSISRDAS